jgi:CubicO group peptidase (beta-lactamase class C family)
MILKRATTGLAALVLVLAVQAAQCKDADPIEVRIQEYVAAFNSGDAGTMLRFIKVALSPESRARRSDDEHRSRYLAIFEELGRLEVQQIKLDKHSASVIAASQHSGRVQLSFRFEPEAPFRITGIGIEIGDGPGSDMELPPVPQLADLGPDSWRTALDSYLQELASQEIFSGTVLLARGDEVLFRGAYGMACREHGIENSLATRFDLGSITKIMTKTAIGQLARDGRLDLDDTVASHLPDYPNQEVAARITINHLLSHSSGLGDIFVDEFFQGSKTRFRTPEEFFELFAYEPLLFEPGEGRQYSNAGYIVLGAIVAAASGQAYEEYLAEHVLAPAGMSSSLFPAKDLPISDVAVGYTRRGFDGPHQEWRTNTFLTPIQGCPAGGLAATADDLFSFDRALRKGKLLGPGWTDWIFTRQVPDSAAVQGETSFADQAWGIAGGAPGVNALLESDGDTAAVVLANLDPPIAMALGKQLRESIASNK